MPGGSIAALWYDVRHVSALKVEDLSEQRRTVISWLHIDRRKRYGGVMERAQTQCALHLKPLRFSPAYLQHDQ